MLRFLLWIVILFIVWKIVRLFATHANRSIYDRSDPTPPFSNIEEAKFEDITPKKTDTTNPQQSR